MNEKSLHSLAKGMKEFIVFYEITSKNYFDSKEDINIANPENMDQLIVFTSYVNQERLSSYFLGAIFYIASGLNLEYSDTYNRKLSYLDVALSEENLTYHDVLKSMIFKGIEKMLDRGPQLLIPEIFKTFCDKDKHQKRSEYNKRCFDLGYTNIANFFNGNHPLKNTGGDTFYVDISACDSSHIESLFDIEFVLDKTKSTSIENTITNNSSDEIFEDPSIDYGQWYDIENSEQYRQEKEELDDDLPF